MNSQDIGRMSVLSLAHVGDAVYELLVRTRLAEKGISTVVELHRATVALVKAPAQARAAAVMLPLLTGAQQPREQRAARRDKGGVSRGDGSGGRFWISVAHGAARAHQRAV